MNDAGLSCDGQTLKGSKYPAKTGNASVDMDVAVFCTWALGSFSTAMDVKAALDGKTVVVSIVDEHYNKGHGLHFSLRDATHSLVVEFIDGETKVYVDGNDNGTTGFGIMTNYPPWPWQVENVRNYAWKMSLPRYGAS